MLAGGPELAGGDDPVVSALERFLTLADGRYELRQTLPAVTDHDAGESLHRSGTLTDLRVGDLMHFCEATGLTGTLTLRHRPTERTCTARYQRGELLSLTLDGRSDADLTAIFAWADGTYDVQAFSAWATDIDDALPSGDALLETLQVAMADILEKSARSRTPSRRPPSLRPAHASDGPRSRSDKPPQGGADTTVKVYFVQARRSLSPEPVVPAVLPTTVATAPVVVADPVVPVIAPAAPRPVPSIAPSSTEIGLGVVLLVVIFTAVALVAGLLARS